jgi:uncharacterized SAM-binding protein YcdF (DUF218 family)
MLPDAIEPGNRRETRCQRGAQSPPIAWQGASFGKRVNQVFLWLGIESWKPVFTALLLPPVPLLLTTVLGARLIAWKRGLGWLVLMLSVLGLWFNATSAVGEWLQRGLLAPPPPLSAERVAELKLASAADKNSVAVVVLGGGRESRSPEYGVASLSPLTLERVRYGVWLGRETGAPMGFSGGLGHAATLPGATEAEIAAQIAAREFMRPLRWTESRSRDTRENAQFTTSMLGGQGVRRLVLVTHGWHMPRALRAFDAAAREQNAGWTVVPAPMGLAQRIERPVLRWTPSSEGFLLVRAVLREQIGLWLGA